MDCDQSGKRVNKNLEVVTKAQLLDGISKDEWEFIQQICALPGLDITMSYQHEEQCEKQNLEVNTVEFGGESVTNSSSAIIPNSEMPNIFAHAVNNQELRVQSIVLDLMECEKSRSAQGPDEILMEIGLVPNSMNIVSNTTSSDNTDAATGKSATTDFPKYSEPSAVAANDIPMDDHGSSVNLPVYDEINSTEAMSLQEVNYDPINTPVPEYVENEHVLSQESDAPNTNSRSDQPITDTSRSTCNLTEASRYTVSDTINIDVAERVQTRSSVKNQQNWSNINTRKEIAKIRYPDLEDVRYQADNNCPDLANPFWVNIKNFTCKRPVFYRKDEKNTKPWVSRQTRDIS
ncbi:hypothetical protein QAD02_018628 [Eretmocerus hayati]|uniref:Uncharacterized protein n=1 Tax=Eretmocerus hayati TaxID=131215 RepID=A0ACC2PHB6_9HYME|nr:hypothetical protein QAD02_018628 [Eretmocerus hayati]